MHARANRLVAVHRSLFLDVFPATLFTSHLSRDDIDVENLDVFDKVNVYGDITGSDIHNMYYGMYSYGHLGGVWTDNEMHDNHEYGEQSA